MSLAWPALSREQREQFDRDGYVVVRALFSAEEVAALRDAFMAAAANGPVEGLSESQRRRSDGTVGGYDPSDPLAFYPRMMHPHLHLDKPVGPLARRTMLDPRLEAVLRELFGEEPFAVQSMFYFRPPGSRGQDLHQDNFYLRVKPGTCMAAWVAVDDADEENGGMLCVPRTANLAIACPETSDPTLYFTTEHVEPPPGLRPQPVSLRGGDVLFFNGSTIHGSSPNRSRDRFRRSFICHYVPAGTRQMSHFYKAFSFAGERQSIEENADGGPCGTLASPVKGPH